MSPHFVSAFFLSGCLALAAQELTATDILRRVAQTYKDAESQSVEATMVLEISAHRMEIPVNGAVLRPNKLRLEVHNAMVGSQTISDGQYTWQYVAGFQQYTRKPASPGLFPMTDGPGDILAGEKVLDRLQTAKLLRQEKLSVDGNKVDCDVIEAEYTPKSGDKPQQNGPKTIWVDRQRGIILRISTVLRMKSLPMDEVLESITVTSIKLNESLSDSLFVFRPPQEAKKVDDFMTPVGKAQVSQGER
jgi:outer membrane lipoprotein-sorting protein